MNLQPKNKTLKQLQEMVKKDKDGVIICCEKGLRDQFQISIKNNKIPKAWIIENPIEDVVTIGPFLTWGHIDAGTSRISVLPLGMKAMKIWIVARKR